MQLRIILNVTNTTDGELNPASNFFIVGIGASAGGLRAIEDFFDYMPADSGAAFVVVQHLSPDFRSMMNELLERRTKMAVRAVTDGECIKPNTIFLIPPGQNLVIKADTFHLMEQDREKGHQPHFPIDLFFQSLATEHKERAIAIVLSGTGTDGTRGVQDISETGGIVLTQDPSTAEFDGMPQSAIATGTVDLVLSPGELSEAVYQFVTSPAQLKEFREENENRLRPVQLQKIVEILTRSQQIDFTHYKPSTISRRIQRRRLLSGHSNLDSYIYRLENSVAEQDLLRNDLLITVTRFFRDPEAWDFLEHHALPSLIEQIDPQQTLRVWVTACATGEEAYSMAILITELLEARQSNITVKIFATDIDPLALAKASAGIYPSVIAQDLGETRLQRFFTPKEDSFEVSQALRKMIIFANHNLAKDAGFTQMHLVSCRNVLIYMQPQLQKQVLRNLHFALVKNGILFLGQSETLGDIETEFETKQQKWKLYQKLRNVRIPINYSKLADLNIGSGLQVLPTSQRKAQNHFDPLLESAFKALLNYRKATCFLVDRHNNLLFLCGDALNLITVPTGRISQEILPMLPPSIQLPVSTGLHSARQKNYIKYRNCQLNDTEQGITGVSIEVSRQQAYEKVGEFYMVTIELENAPQLNISAQFDATDEVSQYVGQLEHELQQTRENLQSTIEELETTNEEQQATNEELISSNEELQSTNEELHSVNEELHTVNAEYQNKIHALIQLNNDLDNLLRNTDIGVIFLDNDLTIRKFTPAATYAFNLVESDIGRPLHHLAHNLESFDLHEFIAPLQQQPQSISCEVKHKVDAAELLVRAFPYLTETRTADGLILTLINISDIKQAQRQLETAEAQLRKTNEKLEQEVLERTKELHDSQQLLESITQAAPCIIYIYDLINKQNIYTNGFIENILGYSLIEDEQIKDISRLFHPDELTKIESHHHTIRQSTAGDGTIFDIEFRLQNAQGEWRWFYAQDMIFERGAKGTPRYILGSAIDISDLKAATAELHTTNQRLQAEIGQRQQMQSQLAKRAQALERSNTDLEQFAYVVSHDLQEPLRAMTVFAQLLEQRYSPQLDDTAKGYIKHVVDGGTRMQALIDGILTFSRVSHPQTTAQHTKVEESLTTAVKNLQALIDDTQTTIEHDSLPHLTIDSHQITQLFQNLISNAIKFCSTEPPQIHVTAKDEQDCWHFSVQDNGIGIQDDQQKRIFDLFQRLHTRQERDGYGIGLAICKKIVQRHNGAIWVESSPGNGSTFHFTITSLDDESAKP